jgi:acyl phosphate:glycerol-3-phosphate acyltransferase
VIPLFLTLAAYLLGSIPTSYWVGRGIYGVDLRKEGSGNLGATNTYRILGGKAAFPVLVVDILKGWIPVALFPLVLAGGDGMAGTATGPAGEGWSLLFGGAAIVGHVFSFWVGFRGGKGVATSTGVFLGLAPFALLVALGVWLLAVGITRFVSLGSILAALVLPVAVGLTPHRGGPGALAFSVALAVFVIFAHRDNIRRLLQGSEGRIGASGAGERVPRVPPDAGGVL